MATNNKVKFLTGKIENLPSQIINGQVYFAVSENGAGKILFDKDDRRYVIADNITKDEEFLTKPYYKVGEEKIYSNDLVAIDKDGMLVPATRASFLLNSPLYISVSDCEADSVGKDANFYDKNNNIKLKNNEEEINGEKYKPIYLKGKIFDGLFKPSNEGFVYSLPTKDDSYCYLYIGEINNYKSLEGNFTYINFNLNHPIYHYKNDEIRLYTPESQAKVADRVGHSLTIGTYIYDGSKDVTIPIYHGEQIY